MGSGQYLALILFLLVAQTFLEMFLYNLGAAYRCSIGFSGVLFGLLAWEMFALQEFEPYLFLVLLLMVVYPSIQSPQASLIGHGIGALVGVIAAFLLPLSTKQN